MLKNQKNIKNPLWDLVRGLLTSCDISPLVPIMLLLIEHLIVLKMVKKK